LAPVIELARPDDQFGETDDVAGCFVDRDHDP
jgi:hypothetical protein